MEPESEGQLHPDLPPVGSGGNGPPDVPPPPRPHPPDPPTGQPPPGPPGGQPPPSQPSPPQPPPPPVQTPPPPQPVSPFPPPPGTGKVIYPMISFQATPCLDAFSKLVGKDVRFLVITFVQSKLNDLPPLPFWQIPVFDSTCVSVDLKHDGTTLAEERGGIWSYPSDDNHWSLQYLGDLLDGNGYAIRIYEFALQQIVDGLWQQKVKAPKNVEFTGKELTLVPPRQLVLKAQGNYQSPPVGFTVTYTVTLSVENARLTLRADPKLDVDTTVYEGIIWGLVAGLFPLINIPLPINIGAGLVGQDFLDEKVWEAQNNVASLASMVTAISFLIPGVILLAGKDARKLVFSWDDVKVEPANGITLWSSTDLAAIYQPRKPAIALLTGGADHQFPWNPADPFSNDPQYPGYARVPLYASAVDLRTPYKTINWSVPADYSDVLLVNPDTPGAVMYVPLGTATPSPDWTYPLPVTLHIIDADDLDCSGTATITVYYNRNYTPPPPPEQGPPSRENLAR